MEFFQKKEIRGIVYDTFEFCKRNSQNEKVSEFERSMLYHISLMLNAFVTEPNFWDQNCSIGISDIGESFINRLHKLRNGDLENDSKTELLYTSAFRLFYEGFLSSGMDISSDYEEIIVFPKREINNFSARAQESIGFITRDLSTYLFRKLMASPEVKDLKGITDTITKAKSLTQEWNNVLDERINKAENLKLSIEGYTDAFNFVGLHQGFDQLHQKKVLEKNRLIGLMFLLAIIITLPFGVKIATMYFPSLTITSAPESNKQPNIIKNGKPSVDQTAQNNSENISSKIFEILPLLSFAAILLYFFRVLLFNYKAICAQVLQIELRMTLCRFIQHYSEHAAEIKKNSDVTLDRFENIIFSGLVNNDSDLPATFDGVEQLATLFKTVKG